MEDEDTTNLENGCVEPAIIPASEVARYSPVRDPDSEQDIARYVEYEADETVSHVELIKTDHVCGEKYEIWDVTSETDRWWVITNITNLYSQKYFKSLDYTLSFHIGLMMRLRSRPYQPDHTDPHPIDPILRRHEHASHLLERAVEPEDYQAVAMQLREILIAIVPLIREKHPPGGLEEPKLGDFKEWCTYLAAREIPGPSLKALRKYFLDNSKNVWAMVNWLTHYAGASRILLKVADDACGRIISEICDLLFDKLDDEDRTCPTCGSKNVRSHYDSRIISEERGYFTCGECTWNTHPDGENRSFEKSALEALDEQIEAERLAEKENPAEGRVLE